MRVLLTTPYPTLASSGVASFVRAMSARIQHEGDSPLIVEPGDEGRTPGFANLRLALRSVRILVRNRRNIDLVHCQQLHPQSLACAAVGRILGKRVILTVHGRSPRPRGARSLLFGLVERLSVGIPNTVVFVSRDLRHAIGHPGEVIPNGVPVGAIRSSLSAGNAVRAELGVGNSFVVLYLGRITADKGIITLLDSFDQIRAELAVDARLVLVGPIDKGILQEVQSRAARSNRAIILAGEQNEPYRFLGAAQLFVLPSMHEGLPLSLLEAMAAAVPAIATTVGDIPEVVKDRQTGLLVAPGDVLGLTAAMRWAIENPELASQLGRRGAELVAAGYDFDAVWERYRPLYHRDHRS